MNDMQQALIQKDEDRARLLHVLYDWTDGNPDARVSMTELCGRAGIPFERGRPALTHLRGQDLTLERSNHHVSITKWGAAEVERAIREPQGPSEYFSSLTVNNVFHGPVGAVQNGADAVANVVQHIGAPANPELVALLAGLRARLGEVPESQRVEVEEVVDDVAKEATKAKPNLLRIQGFLSVLATVQALAIPAGQLTKHFWP